MPSIGIWTSRVEIWALFVLALSPSTIACSSGERAPWTGNPVGDLMPGPSSAGSACSTEGQVEACGRVERAFGNYVTCSEGHATCAGGKWGVCIGDHFVTKTLANVRLTQAGVTVLANSPVACTNICDPYCASQQATESDVDAGGTTLADGGGLTLAETDGGVTILPAGACTGLQCKLVLCGGSGTTTITGTVFDPAGQNPLYDAQVYIPLDPTAALPAFSNGATCDTCGGAAALDAIRATQTDANGNFVLADVPAGSRIPIVVQMGKWRREIVLSNVTSCSNNVVSGNCTAPAASDCVFRLPRNRVDGYDPAAGTYSKADMPQTAIVTGSADPFDCLLLKAGIDPNEIGDKDSSKRIHFYESDDSPGDTLDPASGNNVNGSALWNNLGGATPNLMSYDVVLLPCEGGAYDKQKGSTSATPYQNLINYVDSGGRVFVTHFGYSWLDFPAAGGYATPADNWANVANWRPTATHSTCNKLGTCTTTAQCGGAATCSTGHCSGTCTADANCGAGGACSIVTGGSVNTQDPLTGLVNTGFPKGGVFSQWLRNVGATSSPPRLTLHEGRQDLTSIGPNTQTWMTARDTRYAPYPTYANLFTFNAPYDAPASSQCGRVVYSDFHVSAKARTQCSAKTCAQQAISCGPAGDGCGNLLSCGTCATGKTCGGGGTPGVCGSGTPCVPRACAAQDIDCGPGSDGCGAKLDCGACATGQACGAASPGKCGQLPCLSDTDCGFTASCTGATIGAPGQCSEACDSANDCPNTGYSCSGAAGGSCQQATCAADSDCGVGRTCQGGTCTCSGDSDCNGGACTNLLCDPGAKCHSNADCSKGSCGSGSGATAGSCAAGFACHNDSQCGPTGHCGSGTSSTKGTCAYTGTHACHKNVDCDSNSCGTGTGSIAGTCPTGGTTCHKNVDCDSNSCGTGTGATAGLCAKGATTVCHTNSACDSNSCGAGTGSTAGTCTTSTQTCHKNADCDSAACGSGTGSTTGLCLKGATTVCHANTDCDSGACGSGTGSTGGTCTTSALACHANTDCDSGACGSGVGSATGLCLKGATTACHANSDCDSNSCGAGTGSIAGTCTTSAQTCHKNADCDSLACGSGTGSATGLCAKGSTTVCHKNSDCDSNSCGSGTGATAGTCSGTGTCLSAANCTNGASCVAGKCTGGCRLDADCGTGGSCNNAKCSTPAACASDAACLSSLSCSGAKCSSKACALDANCTVSGSTCNNAKCSTPAACASDAACLSSLSCSGAKCSSKACAIDTNCSVAGSTCNNAKCSTPAACASDAACLSSLSCGGAKCSTKACATDANCTVAGSACNNAKCSTPAACAGDSACLSSLSCTGAKCSTKTCGADSACSVGLVCNNAKCSTPATCAGDAACPASLSCTGAKCSTSTCGADSQCPLGLCSNATCNASSCASDGDCATNYLCGGTCQPFTCTTGTDCASGVCTAGICACTTGEDCGGAQSCNGALQGSCKKTCSTDADCAPDKCVGGQCGGCTSSADCHDHAFTPTCTGVPTANYGSCTRTDWDVFPAVCRQGELSGQEKALEFMFFDLTACVSPDNLAPPPPVTIPSYGPATFVQDFSASCTDGNKPIWREFDWQARLPDPAGGSSIVISAQTGVDSMHLAPATPVNVATTTTSTALGPTGANFDVGLIDTDKSQTPPVGALSSVPLASSDLLRLTITMNPSANQLNAPTLLQWKVQYDCAPAE